MQRDLWGGVDRMIRERISGQMHAQKTMIYEATIKQINVNLSQREDETYWFVYWGVFPYDEIEEDIGELEAISIREGGFEVESVFFSIRKAPESVQIYGDQIKMVWELDPPLRVEIIIKGPEDKLKIVEKLH